MSGEDGISSVSLTARFTQAVEYARHLHIERRKGTGSPAMAHLLGVASLVLGEPGLPVTEDMVIASLLHDAVEDHGGSARLEHIRANFGAEVARMVAGLSDTLASDESHKEPWEQRKAAYIERLRDEPADVRLISAADKLYNARAILDDHRAYGAAVWQRFKRGRNLQMWYLETILAVFRSFPTNRVVEEFGRVVEELKKAMEGEQ